jgi:DNA-binding GntR family transcriptional regulator
MSTIGESGSHTLRVRSVVGLAYDAIRGLIVDGTLEPGARLGQAELADQLGISRGSVREALRRLTGDGLVEFEVNRGFFVAGFGLDVVLERLEARTLLEAAATGNEQLFRLVDGLWIADVGRRLLAQRYATPAWQADDAREHEAILAAVEAGDGERAEELMRRHDEDALRDWSDRRPAP